MLTIVTDILTISSIDTRQVQITIDQVNLHATLEELLLIFKTQAVNKNISIELKTPRMSEQTLIHTDKTKITQILTNLLTNAMKFTHKGGIKFGYSLQNPPDTSETTQKELLFFVKDTGIGINDNYKEKIFERFQQADLSISKIYGGTGLGLSISKAFVELLGGRIWVESEVSKGSTFYFTIPYNPVDKFDTLRPLPKTTEITSTILVAEDEDYNYLLIQEFLTGMNVEVLRARDGMESLEMCIANPNIDMVLMDIKMPLLDGYSAALKIKEIRPDLPIIAQSAYVLEYDRKKYHGKAFDDYITKPIKQDEFKEKTMKFISKLHDSGI